MKKILMIFLLFVPLFVFSQNVVVADSQTSYDENYNPTVTLEIKNNSSKTITTMIVKAWFSAPSLDSPISMIGQEYVDKQVSCSISSKSTGVVKVSFKAVKKNGELYKFKGGSISVVRYDDGTIE